MLSWLFASLDTDRDAGEKDEQKVKKPVGPKPVSFHILYCLYPDFYQLPIGKSTANTSQGLNIPFPKDKF